MIYIGVDPGLTGAVALIADGAIAAAGVHDMPAVVYSKTGFVKRAVDLNALRTLLFPSSVLGAVVFMERVGAFPGQGVGSMFSLGMSYWGVAGVCAGLELPLHLVTPGEWKSHFKLNTDKELSRGLASRLYPGVDLSKKKDHGRAEALLIARYGMERGL